MEPVVALGQVGRLFTHGLSTLRRQKFAALPFGVLSMIVIPVSGTAGSEPVTTSLALSGNFAQIFPNSETCRR